MYRLRLHCRSFIDPTNPMGMARTQVPYLAAHRALLRFLNVRYWVKIAENMFNEGLVKGAPAAQGIFSLSVTSGHAGHLPLPMRRTRVGTAQSRIEKEASSSVLGTAIIDPLTGLRESRGMALELEKLKWSPDPCPLSRRLARDRDAGWIRPSDDDFGLRHAVRLDKLIERGGV
jgi:hypothetical protein